ncbi:MAG: membrane integrity-associated transporter subunit PqiC [Rhodospirillales bacterium]
MAGLLLGACAETPASRFYTLSGLGNDDAVEGAAGRNLAVGVGPVSLPRYLDRPEMVLRTDPNTFEFAEFDRWGEPLQDTVPRVLTENLSVLLATDRVFLFPRRRATAVDYLVEVQVTRFDVDVGGPAVLAARWEIFDDNGNTLGIDRSTFTADVAGADFGAISVALSETVAALSREIAAAILSLSAQR